MAKNKNNPIGIIVVIVIILFSLNSVGLLSVFSNQELIYTEQFNLFDLDLTVKSDGPINQKNIIELNSGILTEDNVVSDLGVFKIGLSSEVVGGGNSPPHEGIRTIAKTENLGLNTQDTKQIEIELSYNGQVESCPGEDFRGPEGFIFLLDENDNEKLIFRTDRASTNFPDISQNQKIFIEQDDSNQRKYNVGISGQQTCTTNTCAAPNDNSFTLSEGLNYEILFYNKFQGVDKCAGGGNSNTKGNYEISSVKINGLSAASQTITDTNDTGMSDDTIDMDNVMMEPKIEDNPFPNTRETIFEGTFLIVTIIFLVILIVLFFTKRRK